MSLTNYFLCQHRLFYVMDGLLYFSDFKSTFWELTHYGRIKAMNYIFSHTKCSKMTVNSNSIINKKNTINRAEFLENYKK